MRTAAGRARGRPTATCCCWMLVYALCGRFQSGGARVLLVVGGIYVYMCTLGQQKTARCNFQLARHAPQSAPRTVTHKHTHTCTPFKSSQRNPPHSQFYIYAFAPPHRIFKEIAVWKAAIRNVNCIICTLGDLLASVCVTEIEEARRDSLLLGTFGGSHTL